VRADFRILGPLEVLVGGERLVVGGAKQQKVLAALLVAVGRVVSLDRLVDTVWESEPPATAAKQVRNTISGLRRMLAETDAVITSEAAGYRIDVAPDSLDSAVFARHVTEARRSAAGNRCTEAIAGFRAALALWRGDVLDGLDCWTLRPQVAGLSEDRLAVREECVDLELEQGVPVPTAELYEWTCAYPLREHLSEQLMIALCRSGHQAEALAEYDRIRTALSDALGIDPGPELQQLHHEVLTSDSAPKTARCDVPRDLAHFTGRTAELRLLAATDGVVAIDGMAGVGKTTLAVAAAHRLAPRYPHGQLFVDLHGHTPDQTPLTHASALARLLRAIGIPTTAIPTDVEGRTALWRAQTGLRRLLVVLDNARDTAQVRPLLPGAPGCLVIVTSRQRLTSLDGVCVALGVLPPCDASALFTRIAGEKRVTGQATAVDQVVDVCGHLPLAIRIAAGKLNHRPMWTVADLAARLRDPLAELRAEDDSVAGAFALSYQRLRLSLREAFAALGTVPGQEFDVRTAAPRLNMTKRDTERTLEDLVDAHLVEQSAPGRYSLHSLLRAFATMLAGEQQARTCTCRQSPGLAVTS
jgi:DNA-binding SARP family transcriptional activator